MLLLVLALFWVALLAPVAIRRFRDGGGEKSIQSFHAEHEVLSRQDYSVTPAHRLDQPDEEAFQAPPVERRPHLRVVHSDDTVHTLAARSTWDEWAEDYAYDEPATPTGNHYARAYSSRPTEPEITQRYEPPLRARSARSEWVDDFTYEEPAAPSGNHYARAYSSRPTEPEITHRYEPPIRRRSMKAQRRIMFARLVAGAAVMTVIAFVSGVSILIDLAALAWFCVVLFVALALYAVSQGYLSEPTLKVRLPQRRPVTSVEPLYRDDEDLYAERQPQYLYYDDEFESEFYEPESAGTWQREPERRRALG